MIKLYNQLEAFIKRLDACLSTKSDWLIIDNVYNVE